MKPTLKSTTLLLTACLFLTTACKTTHSSHNPHDQPLTGQNQEYTSKLQQKNVSTLTSEERTTFNKSIRQTLNTGMFSDEMIQKTCTMNAAYMTGLSNDGTLTEPELQSTCTELRDQCISEMNTDREADQETDLVAAMKIPADCSVTVAEFESCIHAMTDSYRSIVSQSIECESHSLESFQNAGTEYPLATFANPPPPACQLVDEKCPGAF